MKAQHGTESRDAASSVESHATRVLVWDVPLAIEAGATFRVQVGVKCASGCRAERWRVEVRDHVGRSLATAPVSEAPWPDTAALYYSEVMLRAPAAEGLYRWEAHARAPGGSDDRGHEGASATFTVRAVPAPECVLKVVAVEAASRTPIKGAKVVAHPYRAFTDEQGIAEIRVPKGAYRLFVSGRDCFPFRNDYEVNGDLTIRAELDADLGPSDAQLWS